MPTIWVPEPERVGLGREDMPQQGKQPDQLAKSSVYTQAVAGTMPYLVCRMLINEQREQNVSGS